MGRLWSLLFLTVTIATTVCFALGPYLGVWLPEAISAEARKTDRLFYVILALTGGVFVLTQLLLVWYMWRWSASHHDQPAKCCHGHTVLESSWTIVTGLLLFFLALYQNDPDLWNVYAAPEDLWLSNAAASSTKSNPTGQHPGAPASQTKDQEGARGQDTPDGLTHPDVVVEVTGYQFGWRIRYPGPDSVFGTLDDVYNERELCVPVNQDVLVYLKSDDVLHSFFVPVLRLKQDLVPGRRFPIRFRAEKPGSYDLLCAELCGWGHYTMNGKLVVLDMELEEFQKWIAEFAEEGQIPRGESRSQRQLVPLETASNGS